MIDFSKRPPSISVVMPVYNGELYLLEAIQSILNQGLQDFEFIIVDDGSVDRTLRIIKEFSDKRIILIQNTSNEGNYRSRNKGMKFSRGKYICVMDADDISEPKRLEIQFQFMENNPDIGICGTFINNIPSNISPRFITDYEQLKVAFLSNNYCSHPSLIMRKEYLNKFNLFYNETYYYSADYDLCARGIRNFKVINIPEILLQYRRHSKQISSAKFAEQSKYADTIRINQLTEVLGFKMIEIPVALHLKLMKKISISQNESDDTLIWIKRILEKNITVGFYNQKILEQFLNSRLKLSQE